MGTLWPLRDKFIDLSKWPSVGLISDGSHVPNDALWSLEDMAKPFNSLYRDYSNQMSQWYKIIPWNWRVSAMAVASHWEKIPWAGWTWAASEWKSKASTQEEGPVVTLLCALFVSLTFPSSLPLLSLHWVLCWTSHVQLKGDEYMGDWMRCSDCSSMMTSTDGEIAAETVNLATLIWGKSIPHHLASVPVHNQRKKSQEVAQNRQWQATEHPG